LDKNKELRRKVPVVSGFSLFILSKNTTLDPRGYLRHQKNDNHGQGNKPNYIQALKSVAGLANLAERLDTLVKQRKI